MTRILAILAAVLVAAFLGITAGFVFMRGPSDAFAECRTGSMAGASSVGGPFTLVDKTGAEVTDTDVITEPSLVYFGYTFCPDVCPMDNSRNVEAIDLLNEMGISATPIFISIDPERDTPEVVGDFAENFHPKMIGLTGSPAQVKAASQAYKTYFRAQKDGDDPYYLVDHSTFTYLVLPESGFVQFFTRENTAQEIAESVSCFINAS
ncbi:MAG: SCO family protein [Mangrovicoccus sp.]